MQFHDDLSYLANLFVIALGSKSSLNLKAETNVSEQIGFEVLKI